MIPRILAIGKEKLPLDWWFRLVYSEWNDRVHWTSPALSGPEKYPLLGISRFIATRRRIWGWDGSEKSNSICLRTGRLVGHTSHKKLNCTARMSPGDLFTIHCHLTKLHQTADQSSYCVLYRYKCNRDTKRSTERSKLQSVWYLWPAGLLYMFQQSPYKSNLFNLSQSKF